MKKIILVLSLIMLMSCSSSDDGGNVGVDVNLIFGKWYETNRCTSQNNLELHANYTYTHIQSGNITCDINDSPTYQYTGTYSIVGNDITFNQESAILIQDGDVPVVTVPVFDVLLYSKITVLDTNNLFIERKFSGTDEYFNNWIFTK